MQSKINIDHWNENDSGVRGEVNVPAHLTVIVKINFGLNA
jgi:hypothetical protein